VEAGRLQVQQHGRIRKLVDAVAHITFSGAQALRRGQRVLYVTERATFELTPAGVALTEVAPGVDLQRDVLAQMDFAPLVREVGTYPAEVMQ
jgi:propionate CoA-transferase